MATPPLKLVKAEKKTRTVVDTILVTPDMIKTWKAPPFQRPLKVNEKVRALAAQIKEDGGVIPGVITLGILGQTTYLIDGQHRMHSFILSELREGYCDIRKHLFDSMGEMGEEFVNLQSSLVRMRPDDVLRGLEASHPLIHKIRKECEFVGYDYIRRGPSAPVLSMSTLLRCWMAARVEVPTSAGSSSLRVAQELTEEDSETLIDFLIIAEGAWGRDPEYQRLWGALNLALCMWLYIRTVVRHTAGSKVVSLSKEQFRKCLMSLSASEQYVDWLHGRNLRDTDRSPAYSRIKAIFTKRLELDLNKRFYLPSPAWAHGGSTRKVNI